MAATGAVQQAIDLARTPALAPAMRSLELPSDSLILIEIAAGSEEVLDEAARAVRRPKETVRDAAVFYLQQVLFHPSADAYRVLGARRGASQEELHRHMRLLMKWLHPDRRRDDWESAFAERVLAAWDSLKSPERRASYDLAHPGRKKARPSRRKRGVRPRQSAVVLQWQADARRSVPAVKRRNVGRLLVIAFILMVGAVLFLAERSITEWSVAGDGLDPVEAGAFHATPTGGPSQSDR